MPPPPCTLHGRRGQRSGSVRSSDRASPPVPPRDVSTPGIQPPRPPERPRRPQAERGPGLSEARGVPGRGPPWPPPWHVLNAPFYNRRHVLTPPAPVPPSPPLPVPGATRSKTWDRAQSGPQDIFFSFSNATVDGHGRDRGRSSRRWILWRFPRRRGRADLAGRTSGGDGKINCDEAGRKPAAGGRRRGEERLPAGPSSISQRGGARFRPAPV